MNILEVQLEYYIIKKHVKEKAKWYCNHLPRKEVEGFTLAEVLITLTVVGIIAATSIPSLIAKVDNQSYVTSLKKFYSTFSQALQKYAADEGSPGNLGGTPAFSNNSATTTCTSCGDDGCEFYDCPTSDTVFTWGVLGKYFNQIKDCSSLGADDCWPEKTDYLLSNLGGSQNLNVSGGANAVLGDSMSINLVTFSNCDAYLLPGRWLYNTCGYVNVDVNGKKPPNRWGRDTFEFYITKEARLIPSGNYIKNPPYFGQSNYYGGLSSQGWKQLCNHNNATGDACTARVIEEGWQMNY